jgi:hypothetical protein
MLECVSAETRGRLARATRDYNRLKDIREEVAAAIVAERLEGTTIEDIARMSPYKQTQVNRILKKAGLVEDRKPVADAATDLPAADPSAPVAAP